MGHQQPEATVANRVGIRSYYQRCAQVLKVILYLELVLLIGWLGCVSMAKYYEEPHYDNLGMSFVNPDRNNDSSDEKRLEDPILHAEPLLDKKILHQESPLQESPVPSVKNTELNSNDKATTEQSDEKDLTEVQNSSTNTNTGELDAAVFDSGLTKWLKETLGVETGSDYPGDREDLDEPLKDISSGILIPERGTDDASEVDEPFKSFDERWRKIFASIDQDLDKLGPKLDSSDESEATRWRPFLDFGMMDRMSKEDSDADLDILAEIKSIHDLFSPNYMDALRDSDEFDSSSDLMNVANLHFGFEDPLLNEGNFWRRVRATHAGSNSDSKSSSEETTTPAKKTKRSVDGSSGESDENSDSSSNEDIVEQMMMKILSPKCPLILGDDGRPIVNPKTVVAHIKKNWHKLLMETPVPDCGDDNTPKIITIDECGQFVIECKLSEIKN